MKIRSIDTCNKKDVNQFIQVPFQIYKNHACWVPPLFNDMRFNLNRDRPPTYKHVDIDVLIAESEDQSLGRLAVIHNHHHSEATKKKSALFYYFDSVDDVQASDGLFAAAFDWAKQRGLTEITGPRGLLRFDSTGLLVIGFEYPAVMELAYNHPYYDSLITRAGFQKVTDYYYGYLPPDYSLLQEMFEIAQKVKERKGYWIKTFTDKKEILDWVILLGQVFNAAFANARDFYPVTEEEMAVTASNLLAIANPRLIMFVMCADEMIGFILAYPDIGEALRKTRGRRLPFGWLTLMQAQKTTKRLILNGYGLIPEYQGRGATALMYVEMYNSGKPIGFEYAESLQIDETNYMSWSEHEHLKVTFHKAHRIYVRSLL